MSEKNNRNELVEALMALGYKKPKAERIAGCKPGKEEENERQS